MLNIFKIVNFLKKKSTASFSGARDEQNVPY